MCRAQTRRGALAVALVAAALGCPDASSDHPTPRSNVLPPEGADAPVATGHPTPGEIARASATDLAREPNDVDWSGGDAAAGRTLFAQHCAICHGGGGSGDGLASPAINPKPRDFTTGRFYIDASADGKTGDDVDLARVILNGTAAFGGSLAMTPWRGSLSDDDVRNLIAHIRTLAHG